MRVHVDRIGPDGLDLDEAVTAEWVNDALGPKSPFRCTADGSLAVHLERVEQVVYVRGHARLELGGTCSRCLGPVTLALDTPLEVSLFPRGEEPKPSSEGVLSEDDMGVSTYEEDEIDLSGVVHDEVFLELPMVPVCSEGCAGLCPMCGKNLNEGACGCEPQRDSRWEALRHIKLS